MVQGPSNETSYRLQRKKVYAYRKVRKKDVSVTETALKLPLLAMNTDVCMCVCMWWLCGLVVQALDCRSGVHRFKFHQLPLEEKILRLSPHPGLSKTVNWGTGLRLGMDKTNDCPTCALTEYGTSTLFQGTGRTLGAHTMAGRHKSVLLEVLGPAPVICLALVNSSLN